MSESTGALLILEIWWPSYCVPREDIEIVNARGPEGMGEARWRF